MIFFIKEQKDYVRLSTDDICFCKAEGDYMYIHQVNGIKRLIRKSLKTFIGELEESSLLRVHRGYLVNVDCIERINLKAKLLSVCGHDIPFGQSFRAEIEEKISFLG